MAIRRKVGRRERREYTKICGVGSRVITIEAVFAAHSIEGLEECVNRALEDLQCYGSAEVVDHMLVEEKFDDASDVLASRKMDVEL